MSQCNGKNHIFECLLAYVNNDLVPSYGYEEREEWLLNELMKASQKDIAITLQHLAEEDMSKMIGYTQSIYTCVDIFELWASRDAYTFYEIAQPYFIVTTNNLRGLLLLTILSVHPPQDVSLFRDLIDIFETLDTDEKIDTINAIRVLPDEEGSDAVLRSIYDKYIDNQRLREHLDKMFAIDSECK